jgi:hypothetical protein
LKSARLFIGKFGCAGHLKVLTRYGLYEISYHPLDNHVENAELNSRGWSKEEAEWIFKAHPLSIKAVEECHLRLWRDNKISVMSK